MFTGLKRKWGIESNTQFTIIFSVFAINGSLTAWIAKPVFDWLGLTTEIIPAILLIPLRFILILPVWMVMLIIIGALLGQGRFFWKFITGMVSKYIPKKKVVTKAKPLPK